jgi:hypothetical protein
MGGQNNNNAAISPEPEPAMAETVVMLEQEDRWSPSPVTE